MPSALVSGGNRGIGLEVCRGLAARGYRVWLGARDADEAARAAGAIEGQVVPIVLDVTDPASVERVAATIAGAGPLDALVNNAGIALDGFDATVVRRTLAVNVHGALALTDALVPHLGPGARIVMVSSGIGELAGLSAAARRRFDPPGDRSAVLAALADFEAAVARGTEQAEGWPRSAYQVSKVALNALARITADALRDRGILVNAVCPGWVRTRMGGRAAPRSPAEGAAGIVWAATLPPDGPTGGFFRDGKRIPW